MIILPYWTKSDYISHIFFEEIHFTQYPLTLFLNICCELRRYFLSESLGLTKNLHNSVLTESNTKCSRIHFYFRNVVNWKLSRCIYFLLLLDRNWQKKVLDKIYLCLALFLAARRSKAWWLGTTRSWHTHQDYFFIIMK